MNKLTLYVMAELVMDLRFNVASAFLELKLTKSLGSRRNIPSK